MSTVILVTNISKQYRLGQVGTGTISHDLNRWWHRLRGKEDPFLKIGEENDRTKKGSSDYAWALRDINFEVQQGEVLGIIGRNGAGKSTLLKILSRTTAPTTGSIKIKGRVASLLEVGTGFHPELTGRENIYLNGAILGMTRHEIKSKFDEIVDFSGVERYIDTPVKRYSSGMYVRLAFAVAAHLEPEILVVDEVLAVGDMEFQKKCLGKMKDVSVNEGRTILFVSHNLSAMKEICNSGILLQFGKIYKIGTIHKIISDYLREENKRSVYNAPKDLDKVGHFNKIEMYSEAGTLTNIFEGNSNPYILIEYTLRSKCLKFNVGMIVSDSLNSNIYSSADTDLNPELVMGKEAGFYRVKVPLSILNLNSGSYSVKFLMGIINTSLFDEVELGFTIQNTNFINTGTRPGLLLNLIKWNYYGND